MPASLQVVAGLGQTDTISVWLSIPLTISVHDTKGKPAIQTPVTFTVLSMPGVSTASALVNPTTYVYFAGPQTAMKEWTDSSGRTAVTVQFGTVAGNFKIAIDGNDLPVHDTVPPSPGEPPLHVSLIVAARATPTRPSPRAPCARSDRT